MKSSVAITFALPEESKDFVRQMVGIEHIERGALPVLRGRLRSRDILVFHTGVGHASCASRIGRLLAEDPEFVVAAGFAGGLDPHLKAGELILGSNFSDTELAGKARAIQPDLALGILTSQASVVETAAAKAALRARSSAAAVDMETQTIFDALGGKTVPMLSVRSISDEAGDTLAAPYEVWFDAVRQKPRVGSLLFYLATHPTRVPPFARFVGNVSLARKNLTAFLVKFLAEN